MRKIIGLTGVVVAVAAAAVLGWHLSMTGVVYAEKDKDAKETKEGGSVLNHTVKTIDGKDVNLAEKYKGKVLLFVNVASRCGYTGQYKDLEALHQKYKDKGLVLLGFPANNFGGQEPGTDAEIKEFCSSKYSVTFDMFSKISVKGDDEHPLYKALTAKVGKPGWNFEKILVNKKGEVVARFKSGVTPLGEELTGAVEKALAE
jgi:glutathione peroxidase